MNEIEVSLWREGHILGKGHMEGIKVPWWRKVPDGGERSHEGDKVPMMGRKVN